MGLRQTLGATSQYQSNISDAKGWQDSTDASLQSITQYVQRARDLLLEGSSDTTDDTGRANVAAEIDQIIQGVKETANATYNDKYLFSGTATAVAPYSQGDDDTYHGNNAGLDPAVPGVLREIGPGVTMTINTTAVEVLGQGSASPGDGGLLNTLRDISAHLKSGDTDLPARQRHHVARHEPRQAPHGPGAQRRAVQPPRIGLEPARRHQPRGDQAAVRHRGR